VRIVATGSREWTADHVVRNVLAGKVAEGRIDLLCEGGEPNGADTVVRVAAQKLAIPTVTVWACWERYSRGAGPVRNRLMLEIVHPDLLVAFHDDLTKSRGTVDCVEQAAARGIRVELYDSNGVGGVLHEAVPLTEEEVTFRWSTEHGRCFECGLPASYRILGDILRHSNGPDGYPQAPDDPSWLRCPPCAAEAATEGEKLRRIG